MRDWIIHLLSGNCMSRSPHGLWCDLKRGHSGRHYNRMLPGWREWL